MIKQILFGACLMSCVGIALGSPLTPDEALGRLQNHKGQRLPALNINRPQLLETVIASNGEAAVYVFSNSDNKGFFLLSADDVTVPVLGYSDSGNYDEENMAPAFRYWLESYARQISYLKSSNVKLPAYEGSAITDLPEDWEPIEPMIKTKWDQSTPYNDACPESNGVRCYTGCVATSMAQVMKYWEYPAVGVGTKSYTCSTLNRKLSMNFANYPFDYANMKDSYLSGQYTEEEGAAVATLMRACGYSVSMAYSTNVSGAYSSTIVGSMINYFQYDPSAEYLDRSRYNYNEWAQMVYENLKGGMPIIYDGTAPGSGGHSFICDGYDGKGYFHINWGWSGMSDGYYVLDALNPSSIGIGGYSGGFNFDQDAVFNLRPYDGGASPSAPLVVSQYGGLYGTIADGKLTMRLKDSSPYLGWGYTGQNNGVFSFGVKIENEDNPEADPIYHAFPLLQKVEFSSGYYLPYSEDAAYLPTVTLGEVDLQINEKYKFTMVSLDNEQREAGWIPMYCYLGYPNYLYITKTGDNTYEIENVPIAKFTSTNLDFLTTLYYGCPVKVSTTLENNTEFQLSRGVCVVLEDNAGVIRFRGDSFFVTLDPGEILEKEWVSVLTTINNQPEVTSDTEFTAYLYDLETDMYYNRDGVKVTMQANPGVPTIMSSITVDNTTTNPSGYLVVTDNRNMDINMSLNIGRGYFSYPVTMHILELRPGSNYLYSIVSKTFDEVPFLESGQKIVLNCNLDFTNPNMGELYYLQGAYSMNGQTRWINNQITFKVEDAAVESLIGAEGSIKFFHDKGAKILTVFTPAGYESIKAYQLNGMEIPVNLENSEGYVNINLEGLGKGIIVVKATDKDGHTNSVKVAL